jgi:NADPH:quinone reductase-like Zn-dependent oxidoreductase
MRAFTLDSFDTPPGLRDDLPEPEAGPGQLLARVQASSVNPVDALIAAGYLNGMAEHRVPVVLGRDLAAQVRQRHPNGVDALLDLTSQSPEQLNLYAAVVGEGGRIASSVDAGEGPGRFNVSAVASGEQLGRLAGLLADGTLTVPIQASYPLAEAGQTLADLTGRHTQGKLAITLP